MTAWHARIAEPRPRDATDHQHTMTLRLRGASEGGMHDEAAGRQRSGSSGVVTSLRFAIPPGYA